MAKIEKEQEQQGRLDKAAAYFAGGILRVQGLASNWAGIKFNSLTPGTRKVVALLIFICGVSFFGYLLFSAGDSRRKIIRGNVVPRDTVVRLHSYPREQQREMEPRMKRIRRAAAYLDSLERSPLGRRELDSIKRVRPGLRDSLRMVEQLYSERFPK